MRAVLDPNVLVSALLSPHGTPARLLRLWIDGAYDLVLSGELLDELRRVLAYPKIRSRVSEEQAASFVQLLVVTGLELARALALDPPLMLYDEPLTGLDPIAIGVIMGLISRLNKTLGLTSIVVTHHVRESLAIADRAVVLANGRIVFNGTPAELHESDDPLVRQFLDGEPDGPIAFDAAPRERAA